MECCIFTCSRGVACLKFNVRNCGDVVNAFLQMVTKREHLQITYTQISETRQNVSSGSALYSMLKHILGDGGQY